MNSEEQSNASSEIDAAIEKLSAPGFDLIEDAEAMKVLFDYGQLPIPPLTVHLGGFFFDRDIPPLLIQIRHNQCENLIYEVDPIADFIVGRMPHSPGDPYDEEERADVELAIAALQSGIDRLRAYEAERIKAQP